MQRIDRSALGHAEIRVSVLAAALDFFPERNFSSDSEELSFSELGLDEIGVPLFLLGLEEAYQIRFSFLLPLSSLGDICTQIEAYTGSMYRSQRKCILRQGKTRHTRR